MFRIEKKRRVYWLIGASLLLSALACRIEAPRIVLEDSPTTPPTVVVTQVITQVITPTSAPTTPTPPPPPTATPEPTAKPTFDPFSVQPYYPLKDCVASRLHIGDRAMVSYGGGSNGIRYGPDLTVDNIVYYAQPGEVLYVLNGPWCSSGWIVWFVETKDGTRGYTPEGDGNAYWLLPVK